MSEARYFLTIPLLIDRKSAAKALSISLRALDYLLDDGRLPSRRIGGRRLIPYKALESFANRDQRELIVAA